MKSHKEKLFPVIGFFLVVGLLYAVWSVISFFLSSLASAYPKISSAIIGAMTTIFVGIVVVIITQRQTKLREIEEAHRER